MSDQIRARINRVRATASYFFDISGNPRCSPTSQSGYAIGQYATGHRSFPGISQFSQFSERSRRARSKKRKVLGRASVIRFGVYARSFTKHAPILRHLPISPPIGKPDVACNAGKNPCERWLSPRRKFASRESLRPLKPKPLAVLPLVPSPSSPRRLLPSAFCLPSSIDHAKSRHVATLLLVDQPSIVPLYSLSPLPLLDRALLHASGLFSARNLFPTDTR